MKSTLYYLCGCVTGLGTCCFSICMNLLESPSADDSLFFHSCLDNVHETLARHDPPADTKHSFNGMEALHDASKVCVYIHINVYIYI